MNALLIPLLMLRRTATRIVSLAACRRLKLAGLGLVLMACGGCADPVDSVPVITTQPADQSVVVGAAATFTVVASGTAPLAYQWSSSTDGISFTPVVGATTSSYGTGATTLAQSGTVYRVVVSNGLGSVTSSAAGLTVTPTIVAPAITVQPADQNVVAPATATFSVTAIGTSPAYEWQSSSDGGVTFAPVPGAANAPTLAVIGTTVAQTGQRVRVRISNSAGNVFSSAALLTVTAAPAAPAFTTQPASQAILAGASTSFNVAAAGVPAPSFQWRLNGTPLVDGAQAGGVCTGAVVAGAGSATINLTAVPIGCSGAVFSAVASNGAGPDATSNGATLTVTAAPAAPSITLQPVGLTVVAPAPGTFIASATGTPSPTVQWQLSLDGGATYANIISATGSTYVTPATVFGDSGRRYRAVFSNASGSITSSAAILTVTAATTVVFGLPAGVAVDAAGNVYVANQGRNTIVKITPAGVASTLAGLDGVSGFFDGTGSTARFTGPQAVAVDAAGTVYVADTGNQLIRKITPAGVVTTWAGLPTVTGSADGTGSAARFNDPYGIAVDSAGNVYVADSANHTIRKITPAGLVSTLAGTPGVPRTFDGTGPTAGFNSPRGVAVDAAGTVYVADTGSFTLRKVTPAGVISTLAGSALIGGYVDATGDAARFNNLQGIAVDAAGTLYIVEGGLHTVRAVTTAGVVSTLAGLPGTSGFVNGTGSAARFYQPVGLGVDSAGNLYVAERLNNAIRKVTPGGAVTTVAP